MVLSSHVTLLASAQAPGSVAVAMSGPLSGCTLAGRSASPTALAPGAAATIAIHPEDIRVAPDDSGDRDAHHLLGTFMKLFGFFHVPDPWTLANWQTVLGDDLFLRSLHNTLVLSIGTAVAAIIVHSLIAYIIARTSYAGRRLLDFVSWLPFVVACIIMFVSLTGALLARLLGLRSGGLG